MKRVKATEMIIEHEHAKGEITWADFLVIIKDKIILDTDTIECGPSYSVSYEGEKELDGYFLTVIRKYYETDEEERMREQSEQAAQIEWQRRQIERKRRELELEEAEHNKLKELFNPIKPEGK